MYNQCFRMLDNHCAHNSKPGDTGDGSADLNKGEYHIIFRNQEITKLYPILQPYKNSLYWLCVVCAAHSSEAF